MHIFKKIASVLLISSVICTPVRVAEPSTPEKVPAVQETFEVGPLNNYQFQLNGEVTPGAAILFKKFIDKAVSLKLKDVYLIIDSPGGSVSAMLDMISSIKQTDLKLHTHCTKMAASAAAILFTVGDYRTVVPGALLMFHEPSVMLGGMFGAPLSIKDLEEHLEILNLLNTTLEDIIINSLGISREVVKKRLLIHNKDNYLNGVSCIDPSLGYLVQKVTYKP